MAKLTRLVATIGTVKYPFKGTSGLYVGANATSTGIESLDEADLDLPDYPVKELLLKGILRRVSATVLNSSTNKRTTLKLLVAKDKLATALDDLIDNTVTIPGGTSGVIKSVGFARRVVSRG
ncbi:MULTISPECIES: hypothetical protein [unclassified Tolypothrix]|uniref:Uncharacterized protein n=1 Tax=Microchaete diplosiphon TaxID=1197 RepID=Q6GZX8_MICDP|nr:MULTISPECIES: hypothetical protein [unclassified Tolypothrix]AAT41991.1 hypothetical protein [Fremyella diplosiphon Fd33]BAY89662.1 hypothetical protein NIES3275_16650 [Microchaete diplosiphon NIES-3275]EKE97643.1 hypothetical protein FDUTEX481_05021 [Tolypothrix sp. PCC 7601]MBE9083218.1 hypothetical protein [Tolypothrix sp. LEGE 11397]UYD23932.1 hypothetical protein HGR01_20745 [Tolypothrix sp. PCC 7712]